MECNLIDLLSLVVVHVQTAQFRAISALQSKYRIGIGSKLLDLQLEELYVAINLAVPDYINMTLAQFRQRFAGAKLTDGSKAELQTLLNKVVVRRQIENVADQLPSCALHMRLLPCSFCFSRNLITGVSFFTGMRHAIVYCPLTGEQIEAYTKCLQEPEFAYFREGIVASLSSSPSLLSKLHSSCLRRVVQSGGLRSLMDGGESIVRGTLWDVQHWNPLTHRSDVSCKSCTNRWLLFSCCCRLLSL